MGNAGKAVEEVERPELTMADSNVAAASAAAESPFCSEKADAGLSKGKRQLLASENSIVAASDDSASLESKEDAADRSEVLRGLAPAGVMGTAQWPMPQIKETAETEQSGEDRPLESEEPGAPYGSAISCARSCASATAHTPPATELTIPAITLSSVGEPVRTVTPASSSGEAFCPKAFEGEEDDPGSPSARTLSGLLKGSSGDEAEGSPAGFEGSSATPSLGVPYNNILTASASFRSRQRAATALSLVVPDRVQHEPLEKATALSPTPSMVTPPTPTPHQTTRREALREASPSSPKKLRESIASRMSQATAASMYGIGMGNASAGRTKRLSVYRINEIRETQMLPTRRGRRPLPLHARQGPFPMMNPYIESDSPSANQSVAGSNASNSSKVDSKVEQSGHQSGYRSGCSGPEGGLLGMLNRMPLANEGTMRDMRTLQESQLMSQTKVFSDLMDYELEELDGPWSAFLTIPRFFLSMFGILPFRGCKCSFWWMLVVGLIGLGLLVESARLAIGQNTTSLFVHLTNTCFLIGSLVGLFMVRSSRLEQLLGPMSRPFEIYAAQCGFANLWVQDSVVQFCLMLGLWLSTVLTREILPRWMNGEQCKTASPYEEYVRTTSLTFSTGLFMMLVYNMLTICCYLEHVIDHFCAKFFISHKPDFQNGVLDWNTLQAILRRAANAVDECFLAVETTVLVVVLLTIVELMDESAASEADGGPGCNASTWGLAALPPAGTALYLFFRAAVVSDKCARVPALVNAMTEEAHPMDLERQYLVHFIRNSEAGFYVKGIRLNSVMVVKLTYLCGLMIFTVVTRIIHSGG
eukprot:TRINITY_DN33947_c0_g1_i1.p1 TRINITY_DN33947_c0_g1~~TRINITY_DN33947_c0_g1_i1.p1  ORF type:complete len:948 (-),score=160.22 TRINITY_DN33947_c0_g1_i1:76-2520(-)